MSKRQNPNGKTSRCNRNAARGMWKGQPFDKNKTTTKAKKR